jgi:hypothetical protein
LTYIEFNRIEKVMMRRNENEKKREGGGKREKGKERKG